MSIYYDLYENPENEQTDEKKRLHARVVPSGTYTTDEFVERVAMYHHLPHAQLVGAVEAITEELKSLLARGYIVEFGDLGHFSLSLAITHDVTDKKELRSPSVRLKNVHLKVKKMYKKELNSMMDPERRPSKAQTRKPLSEEQCLQLLLNFLKEHPCISRSDYSSLTGSNKMQAIRQLNTFVGQGVIRKYGRGKAVVYILP